MSPEAIQQQMGAMTGHISRDVARTSIREMPGDAQLSPAERQEKANEQAALAKYHECAETCTAKYHEFAGLLKTN